MTRPRTRLDLEARALPMPSTVDHPELVAERLGIPVMRLVNGVPTIVRPGEEQN